MAKARFELDFLAIKCPGCGQVHEVPVSREKQGPREWFWNGDLEKVTLIPSLNCTLPSGGRCHFLIASGKVQFCGDSTHALAGQTVDLPEFSA